MVRNGSTGFAQYHNEHGVDELVALGRCLGDPLCLRGLILLFRSELTLPEMSRCLEEESRKVQLRLDWMRDAGLVEHQKCGRYHCYRLLPAKREMLGRLFEEHRTSLAWSPTLQLDRRRVRTCFSRRDVKGI